MVTSLWTNGALSQTVPNRFIFFLYFLCQKQKLQTTVRQADKHCSFWLHNKYKRKEQVIKWNTFLNNIDRSAVGMLKMLVLAIVIRRVSSPAHLKYRNYH